MNIKSSGNVYIYTQSYICQHEKSNRHPFKHNYTHDCVRMKAHKGTEQALTLILFSLQERGQHIREISQHKLCLKAPSKDTLFALKEH